MRKLIALLAVAFFCAPLALRAVGVQARPFENRRLASPPRLSQGWEAFDQTTRFLVDRMPLRETAVQANTWVWLNVYGRAPDYGRSRASAHAALPFVEPGGDDEKQKSSEGRTVTISEGTTALQGRGPWMYLQEELGNACTFFIDWAEAIKRYERLVAILRASGKRVVFVIPPNKSTLYPEYLPSSYKFKDCFPAGIKDVWRKIEATKDPGVVGLRKTLLAAKAPPPEQSYHVNDTHWNSKAAVLSVRAILQRLGGPVQVSNREIRKTHVNWLGDLSKNIGAPKRFRSPVWEVSRTGGESASSTVKIGKAEQIIFRRLPGSARSIPGRTLFLDDSYGHVMMPALSKYTSELRVMLWDLTPESTLIEEMAKADTLILEKVERAANYHASDAGTITPAFLDRLERRLRRR
jgi:alginate O-acetyltransferase complex protein AlgJ